MDRMLFLDRHIGMYQRDCTKAGETDNMVCVHLYVCVGLPVVIEPRCVAGDYDVMGLFCDVFFSL